MNTGNYLFWLNSPLRFYALGLQCRNNLVFVLFQYWQCTFVFRIVRVNIVQKSSRKSVCEPRTPERKTTILTSFQNIRFFFIQKLFYVEINFFRRFFMWQWVRKENLCGILMFLWLNVSAGKLKELFHSHFPLQVSIENEHSNLLEYRFWCTCF